MLPKGILFDLDDTILAYSAIGAPTWRLVCETHAPRGRGLNPQTLFDQIQEASKWFWDDADRHREGRLDLHRARRLIVDRALRRSDIDDPDLARTIADHFSDQREENLWLFDGALETLQHFKDSGISLGLITNGAEDKQRRKIERFGLSGYFETILIEGALGYGKPEEQVYRQALADLALDAGQTWFVGDNLEFDIAAPQRLGIYSIWNDYNRQGLPPDGQIVPDRIIYSIAELRE